MCPGGSNPGRSHDLRPLKSDLLIGKAEAKMLDIAMTKRYLTVDIFSHSRPAGTLVGNINWNEVSVICGLRNNPPY